jgi:1-acyl-sn-glycerol-3-phosphate acyltransferase
MFRLLYTAWGFFCFVLIFVLLFPFIFICLQRESWKRYAHFFNCLVPRLTLPLIGIRSQIDYRFKPDTRRAYVFASNHFSFFDILSMSLVIPNYFAYVGKKSITTVPLFGYMFKHLHIYVDREDNRSRVVTLSRAMKTLAQGRSIAIYPEGGMKSENYPYMYEPLTEGAFQMAVRQQVPVVPIAFLTNHQILPEYPKIRLFNYRFRAIVFEPIETAGLTTADIPTIRDQYFKTINDALLNYHGLVAK